MQKALGWFLRHVHVQSYMLLKQCLKEFQIESGNILYFQRDFFFSYIFWCKEIVCTG